MSLVAEITHYIERIARDAVLVRDIVRNKSGDYATICKFLKHISCEATERATQKYVSQQRSMIDALHKKHSEFNTQLEKMQALTRSSCSESYAMIQEEVNNHFANEYINLLNSMYNTSMTVLGATMVPDLTWWRKNGDIVVFDEIVSVFVNARKDKKTWHGVVHNFDTFSEKNVFNMQFYKYVIEDEQKTIKQIRAIYKACGMKNEVLDELFPPVFTNAARTMLNEIKVKCILASSAHTKEDRVKFISEMLETEKELINLLYI
tara:strand:+ start:40486 stop:41274 length:789 start_codon:yes stop_codon:yes gene_type:complete